MERSFVTPAFSAEEFEARQDQTRRAMAEAEIDVLVVTDPANMHWLTGFDAHSFYTPQCVVVLGDSPDVVWVGRAIDEADARYTTHLAAEHIVGYADDYLTTSGMHPMMFVGEHVRASSAGRARVGLELDGYGFSPAGHAALRATLGNLAVVDAGLLVNHARAIKSPAEIRLMRQAGELARHAMGVAAEQMTPGARYSDLAAAVTAAQIGPIPGRDWSGGVPPALPISVNQQADSPHISWSDSQIRDGDFMVIEVGASRHRYHSAISRTVHCGTPEPALLRQAAITQEAFDSAKSCLIAGETCSAVAHAAMTALSSHGQEKQSRVGYGIGIGFPSTTWLERSASLALNDPTMLQANMTFHLIMGMWQEGVSYCFSETLLVTDGDPEVLATMGPGLLSGRG